MGYMRVKGTPHILQGLYSANITSNVGFILHTQVVNGTCVCTNHVLVVLT